MVLDGNIKHLVLFDYEFFDKICNNFKLLIRKESGVTNNINHNFGRIRTDSCNSLPILKLLNFQCNDTISNQLLVIIKINTAIIYFQKKVRIKINPILGIFK